MTKKEIIEAKQEKISREHLDIYRGLQIARDKIHTDPYNKDYVDTIYELFRISDLYYSKIEQLKNAVGDPSAIEYLEKQLYLSIDKIDLVISRILTILTLIGISGADPNESGSQSNDVV